MTRAPRDAGAYPATYPTTHPGTGRPAVVKVYPRRPDRSTLAAFEREQVALGRLRLASSVLRAETTVEWPDGTWGVVSESCPISYAALVARQGALTAFEVVRICEVVASVLAEAHAAGLVHGAVTPNNLLLRASGQPVLSDFGLALRQRGGAPSSGIEYAAPELLGGEEPSAASDLYGLGGLLHLGLTGRAPFPAAVGEAEADHVLRVLSEPPPALTGVPADLARLVAALLAKDPAQRPPDAVVAAVVLRHGLAATAAPAQTRPPTQPPAPPSPGTTAGDVAVRSSSRASLPAVPGREAPQETPSASPPPAQPGSEGEFDDFRDELPGVSDPVRGARPLVVFGAGQRGGALTEWFGSSRRALLPVAIAVAVLTVVAVLFWPKAEEQDATQPSVPPATPSRSAPTTPAVRIDFAQPVDKGRTVTLNWKAPDGLEFAVVVAEEGAPRPRTQRVGTRTTYTVQVDPALMYCFRIQAADSRATYESQSRAIRGATCSK